MSMNSITTTASQAVSPTFSAQSTASAPVAPAPVTATPTSGGTTTTTAAAVVYSSPTQSFDPSTGAVVVETRNTSTGVLESQTPGTAALQYKHSQMLAAEKTITQARHIAET